MLVVYLYMIAYFIFRVVLTSFLYVVVCGVLLALVTVLVFA